MSGHVVFKVLDVFVKVLQNGFSRNKILFLIMSPTNAGGPMARVAWNIHLRAATGHCGAYSLYHDDDLVYQGSLGGEHHPLYPNAPVKWESWFEGVSEPVNHSPLSPG